MTPDAYHAAYGQARRAAPHACGELTFLQLLAADLDHGRRACARPARRAAAAPAKFGLYRSLVLARMELLRQQGHTEIVLQSWSDEEQCRIGAVSALVNQSLGVSGRQSQPLSRRAVVHCC
jgi:hypothetical protein